MKKKIKYTNKISKINKNVQRFTKIHTKKYTRINYTRKPRKIQKYRKI